MYMVTMIGAEDVASVHIITCTGCVSTQQAHSALLYACQMPVLHSGDDSALEPEPCWPGFDLLLISSPLIVQ